MEESFGKFCVYIYIVSQLSVYVEEGNSGSGYISDFRHSIHDFFIIKLNYIILRNTRKTTKIQVTGKVIHASIY